MENNTSVMINLFEGIVSISGTPEFVEKNMPTVFEFVEKNLFSMQEESRKVVLPKVEITNQNQESTNTAMENTSSTTDNRDRYIQAGVYHVDAEDGTISILKKIPGSNKSEKTKNIALIVLYIKGGKIQGKELVPLCEKHACYDSSNFAATFKNDLSNFVRKGSGQSWTIELTQPGEEAAEALLEDMINDKK